MAPNVRHIIFHNLEWDSSGDLYLPPGWDKTKKYPAMVSAHPIGSCKEQTSGKVYAAAMAEAGFVALAFDASFQGASGGKKRFIEDPEFRVSDLRFAVDYLQLLPYVDVERIGVLGICGGGGYAINAAMTDYRFKACVGITPVNFGRLNREDFAQFNPAAALEAMAKQRTLEATGAQPVVNDLVPKTLEDAKKASSDVDILGATDYYRNRDVHPHGQSKNLYSFNSAALAWDAFNHAEVLMTRPLMVIVGDIPGLFGAYRDASEIHGRAGSKVKEIVVVPKTTHYDLYDQPEATKAALDKLIPFIKKHVAA